MNRGEHSEGERNNEGGRASVPEQRKGTQTLPSVYTMKASSDTGGGRNRDHLHVMRK